MYGMIKDDFPIDMRDLLPYTYPKLRRPQEAALSLRVPRLLHQMGCQGECCADQKELDGRAIKVEGMPWDEYPYEKIECFMQGMRDYIKYLKRGYSRVSQMVALDLRNGRIDKTRAQQLVDEFEGKKPPSLEIFLSITSA